MMVANWLNNTAIVERVDTIIRYAAANQLDWSQFAPRELCHLGQGEVTRLANDANRVFRMDGTGIEIVFGVIKLSLEGDFERVIVCRFHRETFIKDKTPGAETLTADYYEPLPPEYCALFAVAFDLRLDAECKATDLMATMHPAPNGSTVLHQPLRPGNEVQVVVGIPQDAREQLKYGFGGFDPRGMIRRCCDKCGNGLYIDNDQFQALAAMKAEKRQVVTWCHPCAVDRMMPGNTFTAEAAGALDTAKN